MTVQIIPASHAETIVCEASAQDLGPLDEGRLFRIMAEAGHDDREIGQWYGGWRASDIRARVELLDLTDLGKGFLLDGRLPVGLAWHIARLSEPNQQLMLNRWVRGDFRSACHAERYANAIHEDEQPLLGL